MKCSVCGYDDLGTGDSAHVCGTSFFMRSAPTLEAERAAPCPFCESSHTNVCKNNRGRKFVICNQCKTSGPVVSINCEDASAIAAWNRRTAAPVAEDVALPPLDAEGLPPLTAAQPYVKVWHSTAAEGESLQSANAPYYTAEQVRQAQREVVAPYAERIAHLERELEERKRGIVGSIGDYAGFCSLLDGYGQALVECETAGYYHETIARKNAALGALIAYIDGRTAGTAGQLIRDLVQLWGDDSLTTDEYNEAMCAIEDRMRAYAAAPSPLPPLEEAND